LAIAGSVIRCNPKCASSLSSAWILKVDAASGEGAALCFLLPTAPGSL
jgi:hypothetical protein